jgi:hypothetical protein
MDHSKDKRSIEPPPKTNTQAIALIQPSDPRVIKESS